MSTNPKVIHTLQLIGDGLQARSRRQALDRLARMLCSQMEIPEIGERVLPLSPRPAKTNVEAVTHWLEAQMPDSDIEIGTELLPVLVMLLGRKLGSLPEAH